MVGTATKRPKRPKVQSSYKVKVTSIEGKTWVEERCWKCGRVLRKHPPSNPYTSIEQVQCPSCKAVNLVEAEEA